MASRHTGDSSARRANRRSPESRAELDQPRTEARGDCPPHRSATGNRESGGRALRRAHLRVDGFGTAGPNWTGLTHKLLAMLLDQDFDSPGLDHECSLLDLLPLPVSGLMSPSDKFIVTED
jgi:hypothetical protein